MAASERGPAGTWEYLAFWREDGTLDLAATLGGLPASDLDSARMMVTMWPGELDYVPGDQLWYDWDGTHLRPDTASRAGKRVNAYADALRIMLSRCRNQVAIEVTARMPGQSKTAADAKITAEWKTIEDSAPVKYARGLRKSAGAKALLSSLATVCSVSPEEMADRWPAHLNNRDGIGSILDGGLWPHHPAAMMTYRVNAGWNPEADCPEFRALLSAACGGNEEVYWYLVKALGYALLGDNPYQLIFFLTGPTNNGKSTLLEIVSTILGPHLAYEAKPDLLAKPKGSGRHARNEASMRGMRLVTLSETNEQLQLDELQVKRLTGEKHVSIEMLYDKTMTRARRTWTIFIGNNDMPSVLHFDAALRRRVVVIPMGPTIPEHLRDRALADRIAANEADGVLALLARGCQMSADLTSPPPAVRAMTARYAEEQNLASLWVAERCLWNGQSPQQAGADCYRSMEQWIERGKPKPSRQQFYAQLGEIPGVTRYGDANHATFGGIEIKQDWR